MNRVRGALIGALILVCPRLASPDSPKPGLRVVHFAWAPPGANPALYEMNDPDDQHRMVLIGNVTSGHRYPVVVAMHGQPKRGEPPRSYAFGRTVIEVARGLVERGEVRPFVLALPVDRKSVV